MTLLPACRDQEGKFDGRIPVGGNIVFPVSLLDFMTTAIVSKGVVL